MKARASSRRGKGYSKRSVSLEADGRKQQRVDFGLRNYANKPSALFSPASNCSDPRFIRVNLRPMLVRQRQLRLFLRRVNPESDRGPTLRARAQNSVDESAWRRVLSSNDNAQASGTLCEF